MTLKGLLARAIGDEVATYLAQRSGLIDEQGRQLVVRNGYLRSGIS